MPTLEMQGCHIVVNIVPVVLYVMEISVSSTYNEPLFVQQNLFKDG